MSKETAIIALGLWVAVIPQLGIPGSWKTALLALSGLAIAGLGIYMRTRTNRRVKHSAHQTFVENGHSHSHDYERKESTERQN